MQPDIDGLLSAYARCLIADLPRGVLGSAVAAELVEALCEACRRRLPDFTGSALSIFDTLVQHGVLRSRPSARVMPAALALVASVSSLVEQRSARCWTTRTGRALEPESPVGQAIRARTPPVLVEESPLVSAPGKRSSSIRAERDRLAEELAAAQAEGARLATELAAVRAEHELIRKRRADAQVERDRLVEEERDGLLRELNAARAAHEIAQAEHQKERARGARELAVVRLGRDDLARERTETLRKHADLARKLEGAQVVADGLKAQVPALTIENERLVRENGRLRRELESVHTEAAVEAEAAAAELKAQQDAVAASEEALASANATSRALFGLVARFTRTCDVPATVAEAERRLERARAAAADWDERKAEDVAQLTAGLQARDKEIEQLKARQAQLRAVQEVSRSNADYALEVAAEKLKKSQEQLTTITEERNGLLQEAKRARKMEAKLEEVLLELEFRRQCRPPLTEGERRAIQEFAVLYRASKGTTSS